MSGHGGGDGAGGGPVTAGAGGPGADRLWMLLVAAAACAGALLRFTDLGRQSLWVDEFIWTQSAALPSLSRIVHLPDGYPPTVAFLFRLLTRLGLGSDAGLRFPSALAGTLTIPITALVARRLAGRTPSIVAAWLLALSPMAIWYSQEAGAYGLALLFVTLSTACFLRLLDEGGPGAAAGWAAASAAAFAIHYYALFTFLAQIPFALAAAWRRRETRRAFAVAALVGAAGLAAVLPLFLGDVRDVTSQRNRSDLPILALPYVGQMFAGGFALGPPVRSMHEAVRSGETPWTAIASGLVLPAVALLLVAALALLGLGHSWGGRRALLLTLVVVPVLAPWLNSLSGVPFRPRYALFALPPALVLLTGGLTTGARRVAAALLALFVALEITGQAKSYLPEHAREDNRAAADYIAGCGGGDAILIGETADPLPRYARRVARILALDPPDVASSEALLARVSPLLRGEGDLFLVSSRPWTEDPQDRVPALLDARLRLVESRDFPGVTVRRYARPAP